MDSFLKELPKCEHHVHIEGTLSPELLFKLAQRNNIILPSTFPQTVPDLYEKYVKFSNLQEFLDSYYIGMSVLIHENDFEELTYNYFKHAYEDGVQHTEIFFDPQAHLVRGIDFELLINGFNRGKKRAEQDFGISSKLIMCLLRHLPGIDGLKTIDLAESFYRSGDINGLGLDSSELGFPPELFKECYEKVRNFNIEGINYTAHASEEGPAQYTKDALDLLKVERIDHGYRTSTDDDLLKRLSKERIMLSICPYSNLKLSGIDSIKDLPLQKFLDFDVPFSINSDDPAYFGNNYCLDNYKAVHEAFGFSIETWCKIAYNSIEGSWITNERKNDLKEKVDIVKKKYLSL